MMMKRTLLIATVLVVAAGCSDGPTVKEAKVEAEGRWKETRANLLIGVGEEHLQVGQVDRARGKAIEALTLVPDSERGRLLLSRAYLEGGQFGLAGKELERLCRENPKSSQLSYLLGVARERQGLADEALTAYRKAQALDSDNLAAVKAVAEVLVSQGKVRQAELTVDSYLRLAGEEPGMYELSGRIAMLQGEYALAGDRLEQACDLDCRNVRYKELLARARFRAGQHERASEVLADLLDAPDYDAPDWVHTMRGDCAMALQQYADARDAYLITTEREPNRPEAWLKLAKAALALGDPARAVLSARQALQLDRRSVEAMLVLGYGLVRDGQPRQAVAVLERAAMHHAENVTLQCLLGRAYAANGDSAAAARCYAAAVRLAPENPVARRLLAEAGGG